jgi:hypothetical protein
VIIDGFLSDELANGLLSEFPAIDHMPKSRDYIFGNKHELSSVSAAGPASAAYFSAVTGGQFQHAISDLSGHSLFVDTQFHGGGFHQGADKSFLDMHVDFNVHPLHANWHRYLNCLLYLNKDWDPHYGGELLLKADPNDDAVSIAPIFNRAVIMLTGDHTFHGYQAMTLPDGVTRKSVATYAYEEIEAGSLQSRTTRWTPESPSLFKRLVASQYGVAVKWKNKLFGSRTASNR